MTSRTVLAGDSHLARVRRGLEQLPGDVHNAAVGGASSLDLLEQASDVGLRESDTVVVSVGTNDGAPWKRVALDAFERALTQLFASQSPRAWVYVAPPGVVEARLVREGDRTNAVLDTYRLAAIRACDDAGVHVVRADLVLAKLGARAFAADGVHLSGEGYRVLLRAIGAAVASS